MFGIRSKALLIGINYFGTENELSGCVQDVEIIKENLISNYDFKEENILVLTDLPSSKIKPTKKNIINGIKWLLSYDPALNYERNPNTSFQPFNGKLRMYFHYSGHGLNVADKNGDEQDGFDEAIVPIDYKTSGFIIDDDLREYLANKVNENSICRGTLDCCNSGTGIDLRWNCILHQDNTYMVIEDSKQQYTKGNIVFISACNDFQEEGEINKSGILTSVLKNILVPNLKINDLIKKLTYEYIGNSKQNPVISFGNRVGLDELWL